jgi:hypothetical protein
MARVLRLLTASGLHELTGNNFGCFNNFTLLETVRRRYLEDNKHSGGEFFSKQGRVLSISFFANDDGDAFQEAFFFNFSPKGAHLSDFGPDGRQIFLRLYEVEKCLKYLQAFWTLVYGGYDAEGPLPVDQALVSLLERLDTQMVMQVLSAEYIGAVIDAALRSLAATLDKALPEGVTKSPRQWWAVIQLQMDSLVFSKENQELFELSKRRVGGVRDKGGLAGVVRDYALPAPKVTPVVVTPVKNVGATGGGKSDEVCFVALRSHFKTPSGAPMCEAGAACPRIHPDKYKAISASYVVGLLSQSRGDNVDIMQSVLAAPAGLFKG